MYLATIYIQVAHEIMIKYGYLATNPYNLIIGCTNYKVVSSLLQGCYNHDTNIFSLLMSLFQCCHNLVIRLLFSNHLSGLIGYVKSWQ